MPTPLLSAKAYIKLTSWRGEAFYGCPAPRYTSSPRVGGEDDLHSSVQMAGNAPHFTPRLLKCLAADFEQTLEAAFHG